MLNKNNKLDKDERGIILVLTIVMMAILFAIAISFAIFVISDIRQAGQIDNSVLAYYGAEAGLERSLFLFRKMDKEKIADFLPNDKVGEMANGATWTIEGSTDFEPNFLRQRLFGGQSVKLYFLNRSGGLPPMSKSIKIDWEKGGAGGVKIQVIFTQLNPQIDSDGAVVYYSDENKVGNIPSDIYCEEFKDLDVKTGIKNSYYSNYVVEIRALGTSADDFINRLNVLAYDTYGTDKCTGNPNTSAISNITIRSEGDYGGARQQIIAQIPPRDPVSGLLGYVLFSEEDIT
ncbi:MAG: hypothetical protein AAB358_01230, partial [Patescibacteria group bacterium]